MKLHKDPFPVNMNMIELDGKKVLVRPSQTESTMGKEVVIGEEWPPRMIEPKRPKATFDILMAKYKEGRADIRGHENQTIQNTKSDSPVSLSQTSTSVARSSSSIRPRTSPR
jgi:hypothetical protein